jgi:hypothetical protein
MRLVIATSVSQWRHCSADGLKAPVMVAGTGRLSGELLRDAGTIFLSF